MIFENTNKWLKPWHLIVAFALLQLIIAVFTHSLTFTHEEAMWQYLPK